MWKILYHKEENNFKGPVYDSKIKKFITTDQNVFVVEEIVSSYSKNKKKTGRLYDISSRQAIGFLNISNSNIFPIDHFKILEEKGVTKNDVQEIKNACENFTAGTYKSLMQKIIRCAPLNIIFGEKTKDSLKVLWIVFTLLLKHPGGFLPDIKRYVSGQESALKRLAVCIFEDSYHEQDEDILHLLVLALLSQRVIGWKISKEDYLFCLDICENVLSNRKTYFYDIEKGREIKPYVIDVKNTSIQNASALLDDIKSFSSDEDMVRYIASSKRFLDAKKDFKRPLYMNIYHCIDQHSCPEMALLMPYDFVYKFVNTGSEPYKLLFKYIFNNVTGVNSRKTKVNENGYKLDINKEYLNNIIESQKCVLYAKQAKQINFPLLKSTQAVEWKIDISWISGLVGPIYVPGKPEAMVSLKPEDPYQMVAIRKPSRNVSKEEGSLKDERIEEAISQAKNILSVFGVHLNSCTPPVSFLSKYMIKLVNEEYIFFEYNKPKIVYKWEDIEMVRENINLFKIDNEKILEIENMLFYGENEGLCNKADELFTDFIKSYPDKVIRRTLSYMNSSRPYIEIARISKSGGGTNQAVILEDVGAYQILLAASYLYPKALFRQRGYVSKFNVKYLPLFDSIKTILRQKIIQESNKNNYTDWGIIQDTSLRVLRDYQRDTITEMTDKSNKGKKGHFIWIPGGMGKTMIVLTYLKNLIDMGKAPKYIIYTLPSSAIKSIFTEIEYFGYWINYLRPIKGWKKASYTLKDPEGNQGYTVSHDTLLEGYINVIEHDDLKRIYEELTTKAGESMFVIDEVHKALNDSKRTDVALSVSRLSVDFIALTGTPIVDTNTYKLIWWLEQIVEFAVNDKNFWVAANGMIAKKVNTGIIVNRSEVNIKIPQSLLERYYRLVPASLGGNNNRPTDKEIREAFDICYEACDLEMVKRAKSLMNTGVMMVTRSIVHQKKIRDSLIKEGVSPKKIYIMSPGESIFMTDETVESGQIPDYKIVIVTKKQAEGYTLTRMRNFITSVYPSNNATREQLELRINRISQKAKEINYITIHTGILTFVLKKHKNAASISAILSAIAKEI